MSYLNHENLKNSEEYRCGLEESVHDGAYSVSTHLVENFTTGVLFGIPPNTILCVHAHEPKIGIK